MEKNKLSNHPLARRLGAGAAVLALAVGGSTEQASAGISHMTAHEAATLPSAEKKVNTEARREMGLLAHRVLALGKMKNVPPSIYKAKDAAGRRLEFLDFNFPMDIQDGSDNAVVKASLVVPVDAKGNINLSHVIELNVMAGKIEGDEIPGGTIVDFNTDYRHNTVVLGAQSINGDTYALTSFSAAVEPNIPTVNVLSDGMVKSYTELVNNILSLVENDQALPKTIHLPNIASARPTPPNGSLSGGEPAPFAGGSPAA